MLSYGIKATSHFSFIETEQATEGKDKERDKMKKREKNRWRKEIKLRKEILNSKEERAKPNLKGRY